MIKNKLKKADYTLDLCENRKFVCFTRNSDNFRLEIYLILNEDNYEEWYKDKATKSYEKELDKLAISHPNIVKGNRNIGGRASVTRAFEKMMFHSTLKHEKKTIRTEIIQADAAINHDFYVKVSHQVVLTPLNAESYRSSKLVLQGLSFENIVRVAHPASIRESLLCARLYR